jgi:hypothetical protein
VIEPGSTGCLWKIFFEFDIAQGRTLNKESTLLKVVYYSEAGGAPPLLGADVDAIAGPKRKIRHSAEGAELESRESLAKAI